MDAEPSVRNNPTDSAHIVILDGDDTLWKTQPLYDAAKATFARIMAREHLDDLEPIRVLEDIDSDAVESLGFGAKRFIESMRKAYRHLSAAQGRPVRDIVEQEIGTLAQPLSATPELYPDTISGLHSLAGRRLTLILATKGDPDVQAAKVQSLGLTSFFAATYFLDRKGLREYLQILTDWAARPADAWAIGNSIRSDINPATEIGMHAILVRRPTWHYEDIPLKDSRVIAVDSLSDAAFLVIDRETEGAASEA